ncbi:MAG: ABC transporter ATP-binding protein [Deltaproteobacteria bacterium]|nr:ABC transporter ATP-binding protein [Deltaproteobacteria bacterium]
MALLEIQNLNRRFGGLKAVNNVSFNVEQGSIKAVIGPNGAGKTTLFNLIAGNLPANSGKIYFNHAQINGQKPYQIAKQGISRTYQNIKLFHGMTALENVMLGRHIRSRAGFIAGMLNLPWTWPEEKEIRDKAQEYLNLLGVAECADTEISNLSFGQQRGVEFARALATEPTLLLLDEPAAGLNIYETAEIGRLITKIKESGITVLLVEHDMSLVMDISDEIVVLSFGEKIAEDLPHNIQQNEEVIRIYLGDEDA